MLKFFVELFLQLFAPVVEWADPAYPRRYPWLRWAIGVSVVAGLAYCIHRDFIVLGEKAGEVSEYGLILIGVGLLWLLWAELELLYILPYEWYSSLGESPPPPDFNLPRHYVSQGRYEEAAAWYWQIVKNHPKELLAYTEGIEAAFWGGDPRSAKKFLSRAQRRVRELAGRRAVEEAYRHGLAEKAERVGGE